MKQALAIAVREARTELGLSQEKLAETLNLDTRTILNIEAGRGNPKFEKLHPLITYLKIPANKIFYPASTNQQKRQAMPQSMYIESFLFQPQNNTRIMCKNKFLLN